MRRRGRGQASLAAATVALLVATSSCTRSESAQPTPPGPDVPGPGSIRLISALEAFSACDELLDYLHREGAKTVGPYGFGGGPMVIALDDRAVATAAPAPAAGRAGASEAGGLAAGDAIAQKTAGVDFSGTNVQEAGVDEPDLVKTDGRRLVTLARGRLRVVDLTGEQPKLLGTLPVSQQFGEGQLFLTGDRVVVLRPDVARQVGNGPRVAPGSVSRYMIAESPSRTQLSVIDISDGSDPKLVSDLKVDGSLVAARMIDQTVRLVVRSGPPGLAFIHPSSSPASVDIATESNRRVVENSTLEDWLPEYSYSEPGNTAAAATGRLADCKEVSRPEKFSGLDMVSVFTVDAADPRPGPAATVLGAGELVYASAANLYVTSAEYIAPEQPSIQEDTPQDNRRRAIAPPQPRQVKTSLHKFDIADKVRTKYLASGTIQGHLLNQFSMSEYKGDLRVAATDDTTSDSAVTVLRQNGEKLEAIGSVGGLGKNERIYAVRFLGDRGYVVTFRQTDPLYVVDLSDAEHPAVRGELKIPGYSAYLHPVGDHRLLGVGQDATEQGRVLGTQLSLFDVLDAANPKRLSHATLPAAHSEAEFNHHAFLYWPKTGLTMLPVQSYGPITGLPEPAPSPGGQAQPARARPFFGAVGFSVDETAVKELARIEHRDGQPIRRSLVVGDRALTISDGGLQSSDLTTLRDRGWLSF